MGNKRALILLCCIVALSTARCHVLDREGTRERWREEVLANQEKADEIIRALTEYEQQMGRLPRDLEDLVPTYLSAIPETVAGDNYEYDPRQIPGYVLCFDVATYPHRGCCFHEYMCIWDCSGGAE